MPLAGMPLAVRSCGVCSSPAVRLALLSLLVSLAACATVPPPSPEPATAAPPASPQPPVAAPAPEASDLAPLACGIPEAGIGTASLFILEPADWIALASRLLACSPEAIEALGLGEPDRTDGDAPARIDTYFRTISAHRQALIVAYDASGVVGVSVGEEVPERFMSRVFDLRTVQVEGAIEGEPASSPEGTVVYPATPQRPYGVRLVRSPPLVVLSVIRE